MSGLKIEMDAPESIIACTGPLPQSMTTKLLVGLMKPPLDTAATSRTVHNSTRLMHLTAVSSLSAPPPNLPKPPRAEPPLCPPRPDVDDEKTLLTGRGLWFWFLEQNRAIC